jgi:uncharacterized protein (DUF2147 family)
MALKTQLAITTAFVLFGISAAPAADASGTWLTEQKEAIIRVADCANGLTGAPAATPSGKLCGTIAWLQDPDGAKKDGFGIGTRVVLDMVPSGAAKWDGQVLNTDDGRMYKGNLELAADGRLNVSGCLLMICRSQTRVRQDLPAAAGRNGAAPNQANLNQPARAR